MGEYSDIPLELLYIIFSFIPSEEKNTLCNCALVCHVWLPLSRDRLFHSIVLYSPHQLDLLVERVLRSKTVQRWLGLMRKFRVTTFSSDDLEKRKFEKVANSFIYTFAGHLPNLHTVTLDMSLSEQAVPLHPRIWAAFSAFPSLRKLELSEMLFPSIHALSRLLESLPSLVDLTFFECRINSGQNSLPPRQDFSQRKSPSLLRLRLLVDRCFHCQLLFWWLLRTPSARTLRDLSLGMWSKLPLESLGPEPETFYSFIREVSPTLTCLETFIFGAQSFSKPTAVLMMIFARYCAPQISFLDRTSRIYRSSCS